MFLFITKCNNWSATIALSKTVQAACRSSIVNNTSMHQKTSTNMSIQQTNQHVGASVNVNQHVDSTHNKHVNASVSKRQPTCRFNTPINASVHKHQSTCRLNTPTDC